ncbi:acyl-CoA synthase [Kibdelosporangium aridum]|uniref:Acyl-CoA synthase n=1 Tax=Kibdelosporangium aridum TaxID=2030 RepID=A0A428ZDQ5_KIBAR|nr:AMP-binding protein [Kibdelosporangium aridum]RSM86223.1 acyl-CoA synthase [Kibdelosporangium aridum]
MRRNSNFADVLATRAEQNGRSGRTAYVIGDVSWTHGQVHDLAARAAGVLFERGVRPGERVLLAAPDGIEWVVAFLAIARLGATAVLVNPELTAADHTKLLADCDPRLCLSPESLADRFASRTWVDVEALVSNQVLLSASFAAANVSVNAPLYIQYTSGTTGRPKGVVHTHGDPVGYATAVAQDVLRIRPDDVTLSVSKMFWAYGFGNALVFPLYTGSAAVLSGHRPAAEEIVELVARHGVTVLCSVPSSYAALAETKARSSFRTVRAAVSAGETMPNPLAERLPEAIGCAALEQIGSTEAGHAFCANTVDHNVSSTLGRPVPGWELQLRDAAGELVEPGQVGDLWVRGPTLFSHYLNQPRATARTLVDGWLATHDRAVLGEDGTYRHVGRADDMEMVGGISMSPIEVERVLLSHPLVREAAVAAVRDDRQATKLRAFVVAADAPHLPEDLIELVRSRLPAFKVPRSVQMVSELPRTPTGKLRRHVVRTGSW